MRFNFKEIHIKRQGLVKDTLNIFEQSSLVVVRHN